MCNRDYNYQSGMTYSLEYEMNLITKSHYVLNIKPASNIIKFSDCERGIIHETPDREIQVYSRKSVMLAVY